MAVFFALLIFRKDIGGMMLMVMLMLMCAMNGTHIKAAKIDVQQSLTRMRMRWNFRHELKCELLNVECWLLAE